MHGGLISVRISTLHYIYCMVILLREELVLRGFISFCDHLSKKVSQRVQECKIPLSLISYIYVHLYILLQTLGKF